MGGTTMKKTVITIFTLMCLIVLSACQETYTIDVNQTDIILTEGDTFQLEIESNDKSGHVFQDYDQTIISIGNTGLITAIKEGTTAIKVRSGSDETVFKTVNITVYKAVSIDISATSLEVMVSDTLELDLAVNDEVTYTSSDTDIFTVSATGVITGVSIGTAELTIQSVSNPNVNKVIDIVVSKFINISVELYDLALLVDDTETIEFTATEDVQLTSSDIAVATINSLGLLTAKTAGTTTIRIASISNPSVYKEITVVVYNEPVSMTVNGLSEVNVNQKQVLDVDVLPLLGHPGVTMISSDDSVASFNELGELVGHKVGSVVVTITSTINPSIIETFELSVIHNIVVNNVSTSNTITHEERQYTLNQDYFKTITEAINSATPGATIYVLDGSYDESLDIDVSVKLVGQTTQLVKPVVISANDVTIQGFQFKSDASLENNGAIKNLKVLNNTFNQISGDAVVFNNVENVEIQNNVFSDFNFDAIKIVSFKGGLLLIKQNTMTNIKNAITVSSENELISNGSIEMIWNTISNTTLAVSVDAYSLTAQTLKAFFRFNKVSNSTTNAIQSIESNVDLTLNYWGSETPVLSQFTNITEHQLRGYYGLSTQVIQEANYNPLIPALISITNPIDEMMIGEAYKINFEVLPLDMATNRLGWITSNPLVATVQNGNVNAVKSGEVTITLRSTVDFNVKSTVTFTITTHPGIELETETPHNNLLVGATLKLKATPFPYDYESKPMLWSSSDIEKATVDQTGLITTLQPGKVVIRVELQEDMNVFQEFTIQVYSALEEGNLMDLLTLSMVNYSTPHEWLVYGVGFNYWDHKYESVSRYLFANLPINTSKMLPVSPGIRPGIKKPAHPVGIPVYNSDYVYWIVVHETANTNPGGGALSHANYLWNAAQAGTVLNTSWHFTMDDKLVYQHIPTDEIAYHAGDGSVLPGGSTTYFGGGNRNGIGIETSVAQDGDNYRVWQRTAKLSAQLMKQYNLPLTQLAYHQDFSGKICPQSMIRGGMISLFEELAEYEYKVEHLRGDASIEFVSDFPEYVDHSGRVIKMPDRAMTVSYTVTITQNNVSTTRTFYTYLPGTVH